MPDDKPFEVYVDWGNVHIVIGGITIMLKPDLAEELASDLVDAADAAVGDRL